MDGKRIAFAPNETSHQKQRSKSCKRKRGKLRVEHDDRTDHNRCERAKSSERKFFLDRDQSTELKKEANDQLGRRESHDLAEIAKPTVVEPDAHKQCHGQNHKHCTSATEDGA